MVDPLKEVIEISNDDTLSEIGGAHNQKGIDFQRCWAITRMVGLEEEGLLDFLVLFEAVQDVAVLDSGTKPAAISIYQVKKKDRREWTWAELTALHSPGATKAKPIGTIQQSALGKLYKTVHAFKALKAHGRFVSNAGCDLVLFDGSSAANLSVCSLTGISASHQSLLTAALSTIHAPGEAPPDLSLLGLERVVIPPDDPVTYVTGIVHEFLKKRSPQHAGQARALVDALLAQIGPLGSRTEKCTTFADIRKKKGYSREDFAQALGNLEEIVDVTSYLDSWFAQMGAEGVSFLEITSIKAALSSIFRRRLMGALTADEQEISDECDLWLATQPNPTSPKVFFEQANCHLEVKFPSMRKAERLAHFALRAVITCTAQTLEG